MQESSNRLMVIGWDGATFNLVQPWLESGELPTLAGLIENGVSGRLDSVPNMNSGPAWTSVATGMNPGKHGIFGLVDFAEQSYQMRPLNATDRHAQPIWSQLSKAGKRVVIMNLPLTYPAEPVNGAFVAGWDTPSVRVSNFTYPETLIDEITKETGDYILAARANGMIRAGKKRQALDRIFRMIESRTQAALYLLKQHPWDLFLVLFTASDSVQHFFWQDLSGGEYRDSILEVFRQLDRSLDKIISQTGENTTTIVLSDHGFGPSQSGVLYLNDFLSQMGLLHYQTRPTAKLSPLRWIFLQMEQRLGDRTKEWLLEQFPRLHVRATTSLWVNRIDWSRTAAFNVAGSSQIWINVKGRQPQGIVTPGNEYEQVITNIRCSLESAVDAVTGQPVIRSIKRREELYSGPFLDRAPDLLVEWIDEPVRDGFHWTFNNRNYSATNKIAYRRHPVNGGHRKKGILVARGLPFRHQTKIEGATLYDIAPTLLYLLGEPIPSSFDGCVLKNALTDEWVQEHPFRFRDQKLENVWNQPLSLRPDDEETVMNRLRELGYTE